MDRLVRRGLGFFRFHDHASLAFQPRDGVGILDLVNVREVAKVAPKRLQGEPFLVDLVAGAEAESMEDRAGNGPAGKHIHEHHRAAERGDEQPPRPDQQRQDKTNDNEDTGCRPGRSTAGPLSVEFPEALLNRLGPGLDELLQPAAEQRIALRGRRLIQQTL